MVAVSRAWLGTAAASVRSGLSAASLTLLVSLSALSMLIAPPPPADRIDLSVEDRATHRLLQRHQCSTTGFGPDVVPATAVIRDRRGHLRLVSFDRGWQVFAHEQPGRLVAVCLGEPGDRTRLGKIVATRG